MSVQQATLQPIFHIKYACERNVQYACFRVTFLDILYSGGE